MFDELETLEVENSYWRIPSPTTISTVACFENMVDMFEKAILERLHVIVLGEVNFDCKLPVQ